MLTPEGSPADNGSPVSRPKVPKRSLSAPSPRENPPQNPSPRSASGARPIPTPRMKLPKSYLPKTAQLYSPPKDESEQSPNIGDVSTPEVSPFNLSSQASGARGSAERKQSHPAASVSASPDHLNADIHITNPSRGRKRRKSTPESSPEVGLNVAPFPQRRSLSVPTPQNQVRCSSRNRKPARKFTPSKYKY